MSIPAIILAGGKAKPELQALTGQAHRALVVVYGKTLLQHVVDALQESGSAHPLTVIGDMPDSQDYMRLPDNGDFVANVFAGVSCYADAPYLLIATSDLPFLTGAHVAEFVQQAIAKADAEQADIIYPIVPVAACYARFPNVRRTALRLNEGEFTGGNLMLVRPKAALQLRGRIADAYAARKSPLRLALMLGFGMVLRLALSQKFAPNLLTIPLLEQRVARLIGAKGCALICDAPEIATDLDRPSDFAAVQEPNPVQEGAIS